MLMKKKIIFQAKMCFWRAFPAEKIACLPEPEIARTRQAFSLEPPGPTGFFISGIWTTLLRKRLPEELDDNDTQKRSYEGGYSSAKCNNQAEGNTYLNALSQS